MKEEDESKEKIQLIDELKPPNESKDLHSESGNEEASRPSRPSLKSELPITSGATEYSSIYFNEGLFKPFEINHPDTMNAQEGSGPLLLRFHLSEESKRWAQLLTNFQLPHIETPIMEFYVRSFQHAKGSTASLIRALITPALIPCILRTSSTRPEAKNLVQISNPIITGFDKRAFPEGHMRPLSEHFSRHGRLAALRPSAAVYFPFLLCEVASSHESLHLAELKNTRNADAIIQGLTTLFHTADQLELLNRNIVVFSLAHNDTIARVIGHYPVIDGGIVHHRAYHLITDDISVEAGKCYRIIRHFVERLYQEWSPGHLLLIQGALAAVVNSWDNGAQQSHPDNQMKAEPSEE
ncbi:unnamed protein product [Clonostachys solani]|uniref:DUF7924 domain-containing protein n=1 Tax=Clonostachys solani TaxID=160281 RepID=A0A9N9Z768_9HYPO|nr:unnamed protein product [Clonostachys solani]